jgi:hypothetical protein
MTAPFQPASAKLWLGSLDDAHLEVTAQYNPKEIQIDKQITWEEHKSRDNRNSQSQGGRPNTDGSGQSDLGFNGAPPRSMSIELLFDGYETNTSVESDIRALEEMASVQGPAPPPNEQDKRRPHHCVLTWGSDMRPFRCVIDSLTVKYQMWNRSGVPVRATCTVKLKEARKMVGPQPRTRFGAQPRGLSRQTIKDVH